MLVLVSGLWACPRLMGNPNGLRGQPRGDLENYLPHGPLSHPSFPSPPPMSLTPEHYLQLPAPSREQSHLYCSSTSSYAAADLYFFVCAVRSFKKALPTSACILLTPEDPLGLIFSTSSRKPSLILSSGNHSLILPLGTQGWVKCPFSGLP